MPGRAEPRDVDARLKVLAERFGLPGDAERRLRLLHHVLVDDPLAPTAVRDPAKVIDDHLADSLVALELREVREAKDIADLGSGAGLPGLPLAIALPRASVALVESASRKCAFLDRAIAACEVDNARVVHTRVEAWPEGLGRSISSRPARSHRSRSWSSTRHRSSPSAERWSRGAAGATRTPRKPRRLRAGKSGSSLEKSSECSHIAAPSTDISTSCRRLRRLLQGSRDARVWR